MPTCSFCKNNYSEHKGLTIFTFDGRTIHFCSSKCRKNAELKRDPRKVNWIKKKKKIGNIRKKKVLIKEKKAVKKKEEPKPVEVKKEPDKPKEEVKEKIIDEDDE